MPRKSARQTISRLYAIRNRFGPDFRREKLALLEAIPDLAIRTAHDARRLHTALSFLRAFPDSRAVHDISSSLLSGFSALIADVGAGLDDTGIAGTDIYYAFSFEVAAWLAKRHPGVAAIDWAELVRVLAAARILMPRAVLRLSAGRTELSEEAQALCFLAGANSIFVGDELLTTPNPSRASDAALLDKLGLVPRPSAG